MEAIKSPAQKVHTLPNKCLKFGGFLGKAIESKACYHLLILDNQLPGKDGLQLARRARELPHRRRTPIIMLSASDVEQDALRAGVNAFLRKPQDIRRLTATVTRLLTKDIPSK